MGDLVLFRPSAEPRHRADAVTSSAEILFFTGVRIVHAEPASEPPETPGRRGPPRGETPRKRRNRSI
ncbi:MAG TPA: hypothetical protein VIJ06_07515 [Methylovirgula sp.]